MALRHHFRQAARRPARRIYWAEWERLAETPILDGHLLVPGNSVEGPAVIETTATSVVVQPGQSFRVDAFGNFEITMDADAAEGRADELVTAEA